MSFSILVPLHSFCLKLLSATHPTFSGALGPPSSVCHTLSLHPTPPPFFLFLKPPFLPMSSVPTHSYHPGLPQVQDLYLYQRRNTLSMEFLCMQARGDGRYVSKWMLVIEFWNNR